MLRKQLFLVIIFVSALFSTMYGQVLSGGSYRDYFIEGNQLMMENNYALALLNFQKAYELDSTNANISFLLGKCYLFSPTEKKKAEQYLVKSINKIKKKYLPDDPKEKDAPIQSLYYYAQALQINYKFDEAIIYYDKYLAALGTAGKKWEKEVNYYKSQSMYAKTLVQHPINVIIKNMGDSINSIYPEYGAVLSADEKMMIYTTRRPGGICGEKTSDGQYFEDIVISYKDEQGRWTKPVLLSENVNTCGHEASINLTADGQTLIVYKDNEGGNIYYSQWDGKTWTTPQSFGSDVNTEHWETHACLTADGNTLYFISDRPGGLGGRDIYRVVKLPNGKWSKALNIGAPINTPYDEDGVFIHPDGKTLFFSSNGHPSMGGFDIFFSIMDENGKFSDPMNIGYPINTTDDDIFYVTSADGKRSYYSTIQEGGFGDKDIYMINIPESSEKPVVIYKGKIQPAPGESLPDDITIVVTDKETGEVFGIYRPQRNGNFVFTLKPGKTYKISYQVNGEEFFSDEIYADPSESYKEIQKELQLESVRIIGKLTVKSKSIILNVICFNSPTDKTPLKDAVIYVMEDQKTGNQSNYGLYKTNEFGKIENILLEAAKIYSLVLEYKQNKSEARIITTPQTQLGEALTEIFFLNSNNVNSEKKNLSIVVQNKKNKKPVSDASLIIKSDDGNQYDLLTDAKGALKNIELLSGLNYTITPYKNGFYGEALTINTSEIKEKSFSKTVFITIEAKPKADSKRYEVFFKYKQYAVDTNDTKWKNFIANVVEKSKVGKVKVYITASASKVPASMTNIVLSKMRGEFLRDHILKYAEKQGGNRGNIQFNINAIVSGPDYNKKTKTQPKVYEKYQYVKSFID